MEIPDDNGRILFKRYPVSRGYAAESGNALTVQITGILVNRFHAFLPEIRLVKRIEIGKVVFCGEGFFFYKVVFGKIHGFIGYEIRSCWQGGHKAESILIMQPFKSVPSLVYLNTSLSKVGAAPIHQLYRIIRVCYFLYYKQLFRNCLSYFLDSS